MFADFVEALMPDQPQENVTMVLEAIQAGDPAASARLLPLVYDELRSLARAQMAGERANNTLQPTILVHEAYLRLVGDQGSVEQKWNSRGHFFGAAALAMRRILVDHARERNAIKRGGDAKKLSLQDDMALADTEPVDLVALDDALAKLEKVEPRHAQVIMLRFFAGLSVDETAAALGIAPRTVKSDWAFARAWLLREIDRGNADTKP